MIEACELGGEQHNVRVGKQLFAVMSDGMVYEWQKQQEIS
jgi:hypothetical protein